MYSDILLPLTGTAGDASALEVAALLADRLQAHCTVLVVESHEIESHAYWELAPGDLVQRMREASRDHALALVQRSRERLQRETFSWEVRQADSGSGTASATMARHALCADMVVIAGTAGSESAPSTLGLFARLLLDGGRPLLAVPPQYTMTRMPRHAVVAWKPGREASRALHDGLPLLRKCESVDVLCIDGVPLEPGPGALPGVEAAHHLARHAISAQVVDQQAFGLAEGEAILRHVVESGADLVVAGGYSHAPWREFLLGGVTRTLFAHSPVPVLFSH